MTGDFIVGFYCGILFGLPFLGYVVWVFAVKVVRPRVARMQWEIDKYKAQEEAKKKP